MYKVYKQSGRFAVWQVTNRGELIGEPVHLDDSREAAKAVAAQYTAEMNKPKGVRRGRKKKS